MSKKIIFLEFNEITQEIIDQMIGENELPNFKKLMAKSYQFKTLTDAEGEFLEPWIQWFSIHTGISYNTHKVFRLTEGTEKDSPTIFDILIDSGRKVGSISSMNLKAFSSPGSFYMPDPWCIKQPCYPKDLQPAYNFISENVNTYSASNQLSFWENIESKFGNILSLIKVGVTINTFARAAVLTLLTKINYEKYSWKKVRILNDIQYDIFKKYYTESSPDFATLFLNSTAHLQHAYWRQFEPEKFQTSTTNKEVENKGDAIKYGYILMDELIGKVFKLAPEATIILASGLGQKPYTQYDRQGGRHFYKFKNLNTFSKKFSISIDNITPMMGHQYKLTFSTPDACDNAINIFNEFKDNKDKLFQIVKDKPQEITIQCNLKHLVAIDTTFTYREQSFKFDQFFSKIVDTKTGSHKPEGILYISGGHGEKPPEVVSILDIMPTILKLFNISPDDHPSLEGKVLEVFS